MTTKLDVLDVAEFILSSTGETSTMKLQKLVYYSQAWSLVWDDDVLFDEEIEAWANGPVVSELYDRHRGKYRVNVGDFKDTPNELSKDQRDTVLKVLEFYGDKNSQWLSDLTHGEDPWRLARKDIPDGERSNITISKESLSEYYSTLP